MKITFSEHNLTEDELNEKYGEHPGGKFMLGARVLTYGVSGTGFSYIANVVLPHHVSYRNKPIDVYVDIKTSEGGQTPQAEAIFGAGNYLIDRVNRELHINITPHAPTIELIRSDLEGRVLGSGPVSSPQAQVAGNQGTAKQITGIKSNRHLPLPKK